MSRLKLSPGDKGTRPSRLRPWQARGEDEGWERGGSLTGGTRERHGSVTDVGPREEDVGNSTVPPVFLRRCNHVWAPWGAYGALNSASACQGLLSGPSRAGEGDVPGIFVTAPAHRLDPYSPLVVAARTARKKMTMQLTAMMPISRRTICWAICS